MIRVIRRPDGSAVLRVDGDDPVPPLDPDSPTGQAAARGLGALLAEVRARRTGDERRGHEQTPTGPPAAA